jgi:multicomponent Na+:H+ antiporter subunit D
LLNRFESLDECELHGRGRSMPATATLFLLGGLGLAGLPPFGTFLGKKLLEESASRAGQTWLIGLLIFASAVTGAAVLRVAARVFWGWGPRDEEVAVGSQDEHPEKETDGGTPHVPAVMWTPAAALLLLSLLVGLLPGLTAGAEAAAEHFQNSEAYRRRMLDAAEIQLPYPTLHGGSLLKSIAIGLFSAGLAAALALLTLFRRSLPVWCALPGRKKLADAVLWLKSLHSGHVGDYVAWLVAGVALYAFLCALLLRDP